MKRITTSLLAMATLVVPTVSVSAQDLSPKQIQQSPRSIIPHLQEQFGLNEAQVRGALALLVFGRERLPKVYVDRMAQRIPNAEAAMHEVKMRGVVTGPLDEYEASLSQLGIAQPIASQFAPAVLEHLAAAGYGPERDSSREYWIDYCIVCRWTHSNWERS